MKEVTVKVSDLLEKLKENRQDHVKEYEASLAGYKAAATEKLNEAKVTAVKRMQVNFDKIQLEIDNFDPKEALDYFELVQQEIIQLPVPRNYSAKYDKAIAMMEWEQEEEIVLDSKDFETYILDEWHFTESFKAVNSMYLATPQ